jgi:KipI family sensor histidine kinase inhibitor
VTRAVPAGDAAVLLELADPLRPGGQGPALAELAAAAASLAAAITGAGLPGVRDVIPGACTVLVTVLPGSWQPAELARRLRDVSPAGPAAAGPAELAEIPVSYDGPDLADVAALTGLSAGEVIARHQAAEYRVGWLGFAPGFGYLTGLDPELARVPRLATPRVAVPAGSVAIAGGLAAVYPAASPGGWRLLGRTGARVFDPYRDPPSLLAPGVRVRFRAVRALAGDAARGKPGPAADGWPAADLAGPPGSWPRVLEVVQPGPLATVQDLGRAGLGHLGVPVSGAADPGSLRLANALAGNDEGAACLEATLGRLAVRLHCDAVAAVAGAPALVRVTAPDGGVQEPPLRSPFHIRAGALLRLGAPPAGLRSYLAVSGGIASPAVLGSRSADLMSRLGPPPLKSGDQLPVGLPGASPPPGGGARAAAGAGVVGVPPAGSEPELLVIPGPRQDWFTGAALDDLTGGSYLVAAASNRSGLRLSGPPLRRATETELPSEGVVTGALQVAHDGQPILLLADHPTTGGYPVIAVVRSADIGLAAQLRPGQRVRFRLSR